MAAAAPQGRLLQALASCGAFPTRCVPSLVTGPSSFGQTPRVLSLGQEGFLSPGFGPMPAGKQQQQQALQGCSGLGWETSATVMGSSCRQQREFPPGEVRGRQKVAALVWGHGNVQLCSVLALGLAVSCSCAGSRKEKPRRPRPRPCVRSWCWAGWKLAAGNCTSQGLVARLAAEVSKMFVLFQQDYL